MIKIYADNAGLTENWLKVDFGNDFSDISTVHGRMYFPLADAKEILDNGCCVILGKKDEECEGIKCYSATRTKSSSNFVRYKLNCNNFNDFYVPKDLEGEVLEIDLSNIGKEG